MEGGMEVTWDWGEGGAGRWCPADTERHCEEVWRWMVVATAQQCECAW